MSKPPNTPRMPIALELRALDADAHDGKYQILCDGTLLAIGRWKGERFEYSSGAAIEFVPTHYHRADKALRPGETGA